MKNPKFNRVMSVCGEIFRAVFKDYRIEMDLDCETVSIIDDDGNADLYEVYEDHICYSHGAGITFSWPGMDFDKIEDAIKAVKKEQKP